MFSKEVPEAASKKEAKGSKPDNSNDLACNRITDLKEMFSKEE
jgi:hypothetical protein